MNCQKCGREFSEKGLIAHAPFCNANVSDIDAIKKLYFSGLSLRKIIAKGYQKYLVKFAVKDVIRNYREANKVAHELYPESFKHSKKTKKKQRNARLLFYKEHTNAATSWRQKSLSYPEKLFQQLIDKNKLVEKYDIVREYSFFPYFIDFAFVNIKLAIEIDGSQHWKKQSKIDRDKRKEELLILNNWKIYRIPEFLIKKEFAKVEHDLLDYLQTFNEQPKLFKFENKIIEHETFKKYKKRQLQREQKKKNNKRQQLKQQWLSNRLNDVKQVGRHWGYICQLSKLWNVSHSQVRRFLKKYGGVA